MRALTLLLIAISVSVAQEPQHQTIVVTGTAEPLPLQEMDRSVMVLPVRDQVLVTNTIFDLLRLDPSLDLGERAPDGVQSDVSIRGGSFGQTLILINGLRVNDAQSGHHNLDIPVPLEGISRIEVLRGSGSTLYGSDAVGGVVNIITRPPEATEFRLRTALGNFGINQERGSLSAAFGKLDEDLVFSRDFSSGFRPDRDYRNLGFSSSTHYAAAWGPTDVTLGYADKPFGADQFYGNFPSWEDTKTWFASLQQALGRNTEAAFSYRRHSDLFVLFRDQPAIYTNHHYDETWQVSLRRNDPLARNAGLYYGVEGFHDSIVSNNLGTHARSRAAAYATLDLRALNRFSLSIGGREEVYRSVSGTFSPTVAGGAWLTPHLKARASVSRAFRVPTYTDLYYSDPANLGNPDLKPERAWSYEGGLDWNSGGRLRADATVFQRSVADGLDYVRNPAMQLWQAANIDRLRFTGVEAGVTLVPARGQELAFRYTGLHGSEEMAAGVTSKYVFNYPSQNAVASWQGSLPGGIVLRTRVGALNRRARDPYALFDIYAASTHGRVHPFLQSTNLTNTAYQEILGVAMPGRAIVGGVEVLVWTRR